MQIKTGGANMNFHFRVDDWLYPAKVANLYFFVIMLHLLSKIANFTGESDPVKARIFAWVV
jgi:hypothetical protein